LLQEPYNIKIEVLKTRTIAREEKPTATVQKRAEAESNHQEPANPSQNPRSSISLLPFLKKIWNHGKKNKRKKEGEMETRGSRSAPALLSLHLLLLPLGTRPATLPPTEPRILTI